MRRFFSLTIFTSSHSAWSSIPSTSSPQVIEQCKQKFEDALTERTEALVSDIEKLKNRVRELDDLGDVNNMPVYVSDMRALRRKLTELEGVTEWINEQETLFKFPVSSYPEIHHLQVSHDVCVCGGGGVHACVHTWGSGGGVAVSGFASVPDRGLRDAA